MSSENWSAWVTEQKQEYTAREKQVGATSANECSCWPTVTASEANGAGNSAQGGNNLRTEVQQWPTPREKALAVEEFQSQDPGKGSTRGKSREQWPTPLSRDWKGCNPPHAIHRKDGKSRMDQLPEVAAYSQEVTEANYKRKLNPNWVEQLMGLPVGWTQLPTEWTD
jgi:DNA (cytosine-5)-methyltransferase 1